jgi:hypothetical protein
MKSKKITLLMVCFAFFICKGDGGTWGGDPPSGSYPAYLCDTLFVDSFGYNTNLNDVCQKCCQKHGAVVQNVPHTCMQKAFGYCSQVQCACHKT